MIRNLARLAAGLVVVGTLLASGGAAAQARTAAATQTSCSGSVQVSAGSTGVTVTGDVTCDGQTVLKLATTVTVSGLTSTLTSLIPALPGVPVPIDVTVPAVGVTAACAVLVDRSSGVKVSGDCTA